MQSLVQQIRNFADHDTEHGWFDFFYKKTLYRFPKRAFMHYYFGKSSALREKLPQYTAFSARGLKIYGDNPFHTDAWLGAGFSIENVYNHQSDECQAFHLAGYALEKEMRDFITFDFTILANGLNKKFDSFRFSVYDAMSELAPNTTSNIHIQCQKPTDRKSAYPDFKAICIPHAGVEFDLLAKNADVIITETGGQLVHLATVSREKGKLLIRVEDACKKFPPFTKLKINLKQMTLEASLI